MTEEIQMALDHGREQMDKALDHLRARFLLPRAIPASTSRRKKKLKQQLR